MKIIKEYAKKLQGYRVVIRTKGYAKSVQHISNLAQIAKGDFGVDDASIEIVVFGGDFYKRTMGIEFDVDSMPEDHDYAEVKQLELTLN
jgi:hypothetical protein